MSARLQLVTLTGVLLAGYLFGGSASAAAEPPRDLDTYVLLGVHAVDLGDGTFVAAGNVGVNEASGTLKLRNEVFVAGGSVLVADVANLGDATSVDALFVNQLVAPSDAVVRGAGPTPFTAPIAALPLLPDFTPGTRSVSVQGDDSITLAPGAYGAIAVGQKAVLELTGGAYEFASLDAHRFAAVLVDAPATINIQGNLTIGSFGRLGAARTGVGARDVRVTVGGDSVRFGDTSHAAIDLLAPNARILFNRSFRGEGRFVGDQIKGEETLNLRRTGVGVTASQLCTLTQDNYGAPSGPSNPLAALVTLNPAILPVTIGAPGISSLTVQDAPRLACFLPASGMAASLCLRLDGCAGDTVIDACSNPPILDFAPGGDGASGGQGGGAFVGEVIAAKLNVALSDRGITAPGLAELALPRRLCTTKCPRGREMNPNPMKIQTGAVGVADGLTTVGGLLALADQALSVTHCRPGTCTHTDDTAIFPPNPIRMSDIQNALQVVNECFRGCATLLPCN